MSKSKDQKPAIVVKGITKTFRIPLDKGRSIKSKILGRAGKGYREFTPLNDISFTVYEGDFFGIVGRNGSGKSTLLKTIAGIYEPTAGKVNVNGTLVPFIELGVGFNPNLSGRENVYLNAALLGFSRSEIDDMYDDIVDFAELHDFMEERLQNYSSGMQVRLAFSIAIQAKGDILLLDEVLAVGDSAFQKKSYDYFEKIKKEKKTVILVTHSMANVERFCNRALLLDQGKIKRIGSSKEVADAYTELFSVAKTSDDSDSLPVNQIIEVGNVKITQDGAEVDPIEALKRFKVSLDVKLKHDLKENNISIRIRNPQDLLVFAGNTYDHERESIKLNKDKSVRLIFEIDNYLTNGDYRVGLAMKSTFPNGERKNSLEETPIGMFSVEGIKSYPNSLFHPTYSVNYEVDET